MNSPDLVPTREQARALVSALPDLLATQAQPPYYRASFAGYFLHEVIDNGFVLPGVSLPRQGFRQGFPVSAATVAFADVWTIRRVLTYEVLREYEEEGHFATFAFGPLLPALLRRLATLYGLDAGSEGAGDGGSDGEGPGGEPSGLGGPPGVGDAYVDRAGALVSHGYPGGAPRRTYGADGRGPTGG